MRSTPAKDEALRQRLAKAVHDFAEDNTDEFGRMLGYVNGGYIREHLAGKKPVREAVIDRVHAHEKMAGWFDDLLGEPRDQKAAPRTGGKVPLISWIQAGSWREAADPYQPGDADEWLECPAAHSDRAYALRVWGDSMTAPSGNSRTYPAGSIIFVEPLKRSPVNGQRVIAKQRGSSKVTFKVFKQEDGRTWLQPLNPMHLPIHDEFKVLGTVIGSFLPEELGEHPPHE